ncbi:hypothetical protein OAS39_07050 [Pirellulales bacterium]|nr:hypothetical protein [Pirellulales bacterium]
MQYSVKTLLVGVAVFAVVFWAIYAAPDWFSVIFFVLFLPVAGVALFKAASTTQGWLSVLLVGAIYPIPFFLLVELVYVFLTIEPVSGNMPELVSRIGEHAGATRTMATVYSFSAFLCGGLAAMVHQRWTKGD